MADPYFAMGVSVPVSIVDRPDEWPLLTKHFEYVTPENCMKLSWVQPTEGDFRFEEADRFVEFATEHGLKIVGHSLVWADDDRTPSWLFEDGEGEASPELLFERMQTHINAVVGRYRGKIDSWDVVNEALSDSAEEYLRDSGWSRLSGDEFIVKAFEYARAADPDAFLVYNDYRCDTPGKRDKLIRLAKMFKERNVPVDAIGLQGHYELDDVPYAGLEQMVQAIGDLGFKVVVSELDLDVVKRTRWWAEGGKYRDELQTYDPYAEGCPPEVLERQAEQYARLFGLFAENGEVFERITFWNLHDGESWLNDFPWRRMNYPLLFDRSMHAKPAFVAVVNELASDDHSDDGQAGESATAEAHPLKPVAEHQPIRRTDPNSVTAHQQLLAKTKQGQIDVYFEGDSITRRWGATDYPKLLAHWKKNFDGWHAANFAWGGDNTHNILWRLQNGELDGVTPKVVVLQAGTNNLPWRGPADEARVDDVVDGMTAILHEFQQRTPEATIILTALFPRPQNPQLAPTIDTINKRLATLGDGKTIRFININDNLTDSEGKLLPGVSSDGIHLEEKGYDVWAEALKPIFTELLGPPAETDRAPPPTGDPSAAKASNLPGRSNRPPA